MVNQRNIIDFDTHRQASSSKQRIQLPQLVISAQLRAQHFLKDALPKFFAEIDDSLFDMADKAEHEQHSLYFDAMRELRLQKDNMQQAFFAALKSGFQQALVANANIDTQAAGTLGLMDDEQLEESLAISNMADNADNNFHEALAGLTARLDFLIEDLEITKNNNPLGPQVICDAFGDAVKSMDADVKVRLVIYKLFDKLVVQNLGPMYDAINADLVAAGVLPRLKSTVQNPDDGQTAVKRDEKKGPAPYVDSQGTTIPEQDTSQTEAMFSSLQQLLSMQRGGTGMAGGAPIGAAYYPAQDVLSALSQLQVSQVFVAMAEEGQSSAEQIKQTLIKEINRLQGDDETRQIGQTDMDAIDIVSMLFDFILDDPSLSNDIKAQIGRLQIPLLKVAILDKSFFAQRNHPARQLLNELAYAGGSLTEAAAEADSTYQMVAYVVDRVLNEFQDNTEIFAELLTEFSQFIEGERESNRIAESMLEQARDRVAQEIQRRVTDNRVPPLVSNILIEAWKDVLTHLYLRDGADSTAWDTALQVADDLVWSVQPKLIVSERQRLIKMIPRLLNGLRDGLTLVRYDAEATEQLFAGLETLHLASLRGGTPDQTPQVSSEQTIGADDFGTDLSALPEADEMPGQAATGDDVIEEIILASTQATPWDQDMQLSDFAAEIKDMALGTWVEFIDGETETRSRGKLVWKCDFTGEFTFVDRKYKVVADLSFRNLLEEFQLQRAKIIEDVPLFDRALDSVINGIKHALDRKQPEVSDNH
jgi:hypothetical protein